MNTWRSTFRLARYRPWLYVLNILVWTVFHTLPIVVSLLMKDVLDAVAEQTPVSSTTWALILLIPLLGLSRLGIFAWACWMWFSVELALCGLLRRNMLESIMQGPGSRRLPAPRAKRSVA